MARRAVFLDRDDTILDTTAATADTAWPGDLVDPGRVRLLPGAAAGIRRLGERGFVLVVVSNQGAVARGRCTVAQVEAVNARMREALEREAGARIDVVYTCPYHPKGTVAPYNVEHPWRKPAPGMILAAAADLGLDLARSWMIGDAARDIEAAVAAGIAPERAILIGGAGPADRAGATTPIAPRLDSLASAAEYILSVDDG